MLITPPTPSRSSSRTALTSRVSTPSYASFAFKSSVCANISKTSTRDFSLIRTSELRAKSDLPFEVFVPIKLAGYNNVPLWRQSDTQPLTSHRNNNNTATNQQSSTRFPKRVTHFNTSVSQGRFPLRRCVSESRLWLDTMIRWYIHTAAKQLPSFTFTKYRNVCLFIITLCWSLGAIFSGVLVAMVSLCNWLPWPLSRSI